MEFAVKWIPASDWNYLKGNSISVIWTSPFFPQGAPALLLCPIIDGRSMSLVICKYQHFSPENWEYNVNVLRIKALNRENRLEYESIIVWELYCVYQVIWWTKTPGVYFHPWGKRSICDVNSERTISPWCSTGYAREKNVLIPKIHRQNWMKLTTGTPFQSGWLFSDCGTWGESATKPASHRSIDVVHPVGSQVVKPGEICRIICYLGHEHFMLLLWHWNSLELTPFTFN